MFFIFFFFQAEDGIRDRNVTGVQTCALPIFFEKLLAQESLKHFDKAIALDPNFATAELARANSAPTAKDFFEHLNKAVSLADKTSEGEKDFILANQAGANGRPAVQNQFLDKLGAAYTDDEDVQLSLGR